MQLQTQVTGLKAELDKVYDEKHSLKEEVIELKHRVNNLGDCEKAVDRLKEILTRKDEELATANRRIEDQLS